MEFHKIPSTKELMTSTSLALGEAYMKGDIEIHGDLYETLNLFLGQLGKFSTDYKKLHKLIFTSKSQRNQKEHLENQLEVRLMDYRNLPNSDLQFDAAVSVGMVEHVGRGNYEIFLNCVISILKPGGVFPV